jgi:hypothetical protein
MLQKLLKSSLVNAVVDTPVASIDTFVVWLVTLPVLSPVDTLSGTPV